MEKSVDSIELHSTGWQLGETLTGGLFSESVQFVAQFDQQLAECFVEYAFGEVLAKGTLPIEDRQLCIIAALTVLGEQSQLKWHINAAFNIEIKAEQVCETLIHCIPFFGWPKALNALQVFKDVLTERGVWQSFSAGRSSGSQSTSPGDTSLRDKGLYNGALLYDDYPATENAVREYDEGLPKLVTEGIFGRFYGREGLSIRQRQLEAVALLTAGQRLPQLKSHINGAHRVGCSWQEIKETIILMHLYAGWPAVLNALQVWKDVSDTKEKGE